MTRRDTSADAFEAFVRGTDLPSVTLDGRDMRTIQQALEEADTALRHAETSKVSYISRAARSARARVQHAWAIVKPKAASG
ncbi:hypothetical protein [Hyphomicrobium sp. 802]|uniref:hypothetical protein n=1 Tax=Hyphomicrobium sp. 802 TaxID=1112272 RepID=UPI00045E79E6|nr:hypothetical protein [Hyphomicrobium sp. 802]